MENYNFLLSRVDQRLGKKTIRTPLVVGAGSFLLVWCGTRTRDGWWVQVGRRFRQPLERVGASRCSCMHAPAASGLPLNLLSHGGRLSGWRRSKSIVCPAARHIAWAWAWAWQGTAACILILPLPLRPPEILRSESSDERRRPTVAAQSFPRTRWGC